MRSIFHSRQKFNKGFTLLELLVVIAIIGILVSLGVASFTTAQKRGRNAKRLEDVQNIQSAFEQYFVINQAYAAKATMAIDNLVGDIIPSDPLGSNYAISVNIANGTYCICAQLEGEDGNAAGPSGADNSVCNYGGTGYYCTNQLQ